MLAPSTLTIENLKKDVGWPAEGVLGLGSWDVMLKVLGYYLFSMVLHTVLPGEEAEGVELSSGGRLKYRFNSMLDHNMKILRFTDSHSLVFQHTYSLTMRRRHRCSRR